MPMGQIVGCAPRTITARYDGLALMHCERCDRSSLERRTLLSLSEHIRGTATGAKEDMDLER